MNFFKDKSKVRVLIIIILLLVIFELIVVVSNALAARTEESDLYRKSYAIQAEIEKVFLNVFTISDAYVSFISETPSTTKEETESFLRHLLSHEENYVNNIAFVENTTIKFNYPHEENIDSIGVDLSLIDGQKEDVIFVKDSETSLLIGPVELVQGGNAFILRTPIISNDEYFGQIATVINADDLIGLLEVEADRYSIELTIAYHNEASFIEIGNDFDKTNVKTEISTKHATWDLIVFNQSSGNADDFINYGIRAIGIFVIVIVSYYSYRNEKLISQVKYRATHDILTNNFNRSMFSEDFKAQKIIGKLVAFMDINKFKLLNDTLGHHFGDWALIRLSQEFESFDMFTTYRNSGDEFILVSKAPMSEEEFLNMTNGFVYSFYNEELQQNIDIDLAVGVIEKVSEDLVLEDMLMYLDYAMYDAKKHRIAYTLVDDDLMRKYYQQKQMEQVLIEDVKNNNFITYYQPIIDIKNKRIDSVEVLSRWRYKGEIIAAANFIGIVKKIKYIENIDQNLFVNLQQEYQVIIDACEDCENMKYAINLSAEILKEFEKNFSKFDTYIKDIIIPVDKVIFEISEDINLGIISNETIEYIRDKGFSLVIDDFGSGVSKLSDVLSGKLLAIKTDKSMLPINKDDTKRIEGFNTIVKAINSTGSKVCVEGVETIEQLEISLEAGCEILQGYLFGKPMSLEEIILYINNFDFNSIIE